MKVTTRNDCVIFWWGYNYELGFNTSNTVRPGHGGMSAEAKRNIF